MPLLPDPDELLAVADRILAHAGAASARADALAGAVSAADWHGPASDAFHHCSSGVLAGLRSSAGRLADAAAALRNHAHRVAEVLAAAELVGRDLRRLSGELVHDVGGVVHGAGALLGDAVEVFGR